MSNTNSSPSTLTITDAPGSWPLDKDVADVSGFHALCTSSIRSYGIFQDTYFLKLLPGRTEVLEKELRMMLLAGDCSVPPIGRVYDNGQLSGFLTLCEKPITAPHKPWETAIVSPDLTRDERLDLIDRFRLLLNRLHDKGLLHGDVKPSNLLCCSDGSLRFCDFAEAFVEDQSGPPRAATTRYQSPYMLRTYPLPSLTRAEDLYAAGITVWEIYTGRIPFEDVDEEEIEDFIGEGARPDLALVDDPAIAALITNYLDLGDRVLRNTQK